MSPDARAIRLVGEMSGAREREALLRWWECCDAFERNVRDVGGLLLGPPLGTFTEALHLAIYDPVTDSITWQEQTLSIEEINRLERYAS